MSAPAILIDASARGPKRGERTVTVKLNDTILHVGTCVLVNAKARTAFLAEIKAAGTGQINENDLNQVEQTLLEFAAEAAAQDTNGEETDAVRLGPQYEETSDGIVWLKPDSDGLIRVLLSTFTAQITQQILRDDGTGEPTLHYRIEANVGSHTAEGTVSATNFGNVDRWAGELLGVEARVFPGSMSKDRVRDAVQALSAGAPRCTSFLHTGWTRIQGRYMYLHGAGAIWAEGNDSSIDTDLPPALEPFHLPDPPTGATLVQAIRTSVELLNLAGDPVVVPLLGAVYRAVLPASADLSIHLTGGTGAGKSELAARAMQHFGSGFSRTGLPSWASTANSLESLAFTAKDALLVVDDFAPAGTRHDVARQHREADRILRAQGNLSGRGRCNTDGSLRSARAPRGLILSTGEDVPRGASLQARLLIVDVPPKGIPGCVDFEHKLSDAQSHGDRGDYAMNMAGYIQWIAANYEEVLEGVRRQFSKLRGQALGIKGHARDPEKFAHLAVGWHMFLRFATHAGALTLQETAEIWERARNALLEATAVQADHHRVADPALRFLDLIGSAVQAGTAHLRDPQAAGGRPAAASKFGWRERVWSSGDPQANGRGGGSEWIPGGPCVGWVTGDDVCLIPDAAIKAANAADGSGGDGVALGVRSLGKRLLEAGLILKREKGRATSKITRGGETIRGWRLSPAASDRGDRGRSGTSGRQVPAAPDSAPRYGADSGENPRYASETGELECESTPPGASVSQGTPRSPRFREGEETEDPEAPLPGAEVIQ